MPGEQQAEESIQRRAFERRDTMAKMSDYEQAQADGIEKWKAEEPGAISQIFGIVVQPLAWLVQQVVPEAAIQGALDFASAAGKWLADTADILHEAEVEKVAELRTKDLSLSDRLADEIHNWAIGVAVVEGTATGTFGILGAPVDVPAIITVAMRTIHKVGLCYGYECESEPDRQFVLGILAASRANSIEEKVTALTTLRALEVLIARQTWKSMAEKAAQSQLSKEAAILGIKNLARQLGINITKRRALAAIPAIGAFIGGSVNGWYVKDVGWAARRAFQERWLRDNDKLIDIES
jgi:EcsC protein family